MCMPLIIIISVYIFSNVNFLHMYYIKKWVILRYSRSTENGASSSHIHDEICLLNSWWGPPWMWEEGALFFHASGVSKYFPPNTSVEAFNKSSKSNTLATFPTNTNFLAPAPPPFAYAFAVLVIVAATATTTEYPFPYPPFPSSFTDFLPGISTRVLHHSNVDCALLLITTLLLAQNIKITTSNRKPNTNPIAIPAIAPPNNFLLLLLPPPLLSLRTWTFTGH